MKTLVLAILATALIVAPAAAQAPAMAPAPAAAGGLSVEKTKIKDLAANPRAKAAVEKVLPEIAQYWDQIGDQTLAELVPMSQGALTPDKLKAIQAELDKIK